MANFNELVEYLQIKLKEVTGEDIVYSPIMKFENEMLQKNKNANALSIYLKNSNPVRNTMGGIIYTDCIFNIEIRNDKVINSNEIVEKINHFRINSILYKSTKIALGRVDGTSFLGEDTNKNLGYSANLYVSYY